MDSLRIDSIGNLPAGLCWATNKTTNTFRNSETGCIKLSGTTCSTPGQYNLFILVTVWTSPPLLGANPTGPVPASAFGVYYYLRVNNTGEATVAVDTAGQAAGTNRFVPYGPEANCSSGSLTVSLGSNQTVCPNTSVNLTASITNGQSPYTYSWSYAGNQLSCNSCTSPSATITEGSTYRVTITDNNHQTASATVYYALATTGCAENLSVSLSANQNQEVCPGTPVNLTANISNGQSPYTYSWSYVGSPLNCNSCTNPTATITQISTYTVTVTDNSHQTASAVIYFYPLTAPGTIQINVNGSTSLCTGQSTVLSASQSGLAYNWSNGATTASIEVSQQATYTVTVTNNSGCISTGTIFINVVSPPTPQTIIGNPSVAPFVVYPYLVNSVSGITYAWAIEGGVIQSGQGTNSINVVWGATPPYLVTLVETNTTGCADTANLQVHLSTGLNSLTDNDAWQLYPNPAHNYLVLNNSDLTDVAGYSLKVINTLGQVVYVQALKQHQTQIELTNWGVGGVYFVAIVEAKQNTIAVKKIVLQ